MLLPAYTERYLPGSITTHLVQGEVPTLDLILAYHKANKSPVNVTGNDKAGHGTTS
jgi:LysR family transcriptional regulator, hca operon transcriptional activator